MWEPAAQHHFSRPLLLRGALFVLYLVRMRDKQSAQVQRFLRSNCWLAVFICIFRKGDLLTVASWRSDRGLARWFRKRQRCSSISKAMCRCNDWLIFIVATVIFSIQLIFPPISLPCTPQLYIVFRATHSHPKFTRAFLGECQRSRIKMNWATILTLLSHTTSMLGLELFSMALPRLHCPSPFSLSTEQTWYHLFQFSNSFAFLRISSFQGER